jgi:hypothetical protein
MMCHTPVGPAGIIWTIGHSNHPPETLFALLTQHRMEVVVEKIRKTKGQLSLFDTEEPRLLG